MYQTIHTECELDGGVITPLRDTATHLDARRCGPSDPVERIGAAAAVSVELVLDPPPASVQRANAG